MGYRQIGERIQRAREEAGLKQAELAAQIGRTQAALSNYELGRRRVYLTDLERIANALGKPLSYFMEDEQESAGDDERSADLMTLLRDEELREMLIGASTLPADERKAVLDYIRWRRSRLRGE